MPVALDQGPGVYVQELPSGVHTITGVATAITAFIGWAPQGPTDKAVLVQSWTEYARKFGGFDSRTWLAYAVYHFFANQGSQALIVRVADSKTAVSAKLGAPLGGLMIAANGQGEWANSYGVIVPYAKKNAVGDDRFTLNIVQSISPTNQPVVETYTNLSMDPTADRYAVEVITQESELVIATATAQQAPTEALPFSPLTGGVDGDVVDPVDFPAQLGGAVATKIPILDTVDLFNLMCIPGLTDTSTLNEFQTYCQSRRAFLIADSQQGIDVATAANTPPSIAAGDLAPYGALYYPWIRMQDPLKPGYWRAMPPCGIIAGIYARTDSERGVWKAPAGIQASVNGGAFDLDTKLTNAQNGTLNSVGVNCIRNFPVYGIVVWGARTLAGDDNLGSDWKYIPVRRTASFIEESLIRGTQWVVFEPNDEPLWAQIRLNVGAFMHDLFRQGAFQGQTPKDAYFVKCDKDTTTQNDINRGVVNILVGFAPLKPAEFVVIQIQQIAGQIQT
jgi:hypothetical protein